MYRFTSIKHTFSRSIPISLSGLTALTGLAWLTAAELAFLILSIFITPEKSPVRGKKKKRGKYAGKKRRIIFDENRYALLNVTKRLHGKSKTTFIDMVGTTRPAPTGSGPEFFGAAGIPLAVAAVAGVNVYHRGHGCFCE